MRIRHWIRKSLLPLFVLWIAGAGAAAAQPSTAPDLDKIIRASHIVFVGTVEKPGASNLSLIPASARTALVRVREVLDAPATVGDLKGQLVTVFLVQEGSVQAGQTAIFFTNGWMYGENVAVREVARIPDSDHDALRARIAAVRRNADDEALAARLASAVLVVDGEAQKVRPVEGKNGSPRGEHDPDWWRADIVVGSVLKGKPAGPTVAVFFPHSLDERWLLAPKLHEGQRAIFLLQPYRGADLPDGSLVLLLPLDVQPEQAMERLRHLMP
jgi:hypothetical protein